MQPEKAMQQKSLIPNCTVDVMIILVFDKQWLWQLAHFMSSGLRENSSSLWVKRSDPEIILWRSSQPSVSNIKYTDSSKQIHPDKIQLHAVGQYVSLVFYVCIAEQCDSKSYFQPKLTFHIASKHAQIWLCYWIIIFLWRNASSLYCARGLNDSLCESLCLLDQHGCFTTWYHTTPLWLN